MCPDFALGSSATLKGALRRPVKITVLDGKTVISERVVLGKRLATDPASLLIVQDENETFTVRFAQCGNDFAPQPIEKTGDKDARRREDFTSYDCGDAAVYQELALDVKKGSPGSRVVPWQAPPATECLGAVPPDAGSP